MYFVLSGEVHIFGPDGKTATLPRSLLRVQLLS